jgi:hypothetical protein
LGRIWPLGSVVAILLAAAQDVHDGDVQHGHAGA